MDHFITQKQAQGLEKENESLKNQLKLMEDDLDFYEQDAPCGHPQKFWKVEPNQDAWCTLCAIEGLARQNLAKSTWAFVWKRAAKGYRKRVKLLMQQHLVDTSVADREIERLENELDSITKTATAMGAELSAHRDKAVILQLDVEKFRKALKAMTATTDPVCECGKPISAHILYDDGIRRYCEIDRDGNVILECDGFKRLEI